MQCAGHVRVENARLIGRSDLELDGAPVTRQSVCEAELCLRRNSARREHDGRITGDSRVVDYMAFVVI